jgi:hypothetical protein
MVSGLDVSMTDEIFERKGNTVKTAASVQAINDRYNTSLPNI